MRHKTTTDIYSYWNGLRGTNSVPSRSQVEPADIRHILPDLFILERKAATGIRFRLAGTHICALFARELRGSTFDALWLGEQTRRLDRVAADVMAKRTPAILSALAIAGGRERLPIEITLLPLMSPDGTVDRIIGSLVPLSRPHWLHATPVNFLDVAGIRVLDTDKTNVFLQNRPGIRLPAGVERTRAEGIGSAIRRVLHLRVFDGGRRD